MKRRQYWMGAWCLFFLITFGIANIGFPRQAMAQPLPQPVPENTANRPAPVSVRSDSRKRVLPAPTWDGRWNGSDGHEFSFRLLLSFNNANRATGRFVWTLRKAPSTSSVYRRIGQSGIEYVQGQYKPETREIHLEGTRLEHDQLLALDAYRLSLSTDGKSFSGVTRGNGGWDNRIQARSVSLTASAPTPTGLFDGQWQGFWRGDEGARYRFVLQLEIKNGQCSGVILWTKQAPANIFGDRQGVGQSGREYVSGTFDPVTWQLFLKGYRVDAPTLIGMDEYRLTIAKGDRSLSGVSRNHSGAWSSPMQGTYAARPRR